MAFQRDELITIRHEFERGFHQTVNVSPLRASIEFDETDAVRYCLTSVIQDMYSGRYKDFMWLMSRLPLNDPHVEVMDIVEIHAEILRVLDELITEQS